MERVQPEFDMASLMVDLQREILLWLPAEDLIEMRRVCKTWRKLIGSRQFAELHVERWRLRGGMVWSSSEPEAMSVSCLPPGHSEARYARGFPDIWSHEILDSCDGLLLFRAGVCEPRLAVCNPLTKSHEVLDIGGNYRVRDLLSWSIAFDLSTKRYKLIGVGLPHNPKKGSTRLTKRDVIVPGFIYELEPPWRPCRRTVEISLPSGEIKGPPLARISKPGKLHWLIQGIEKGDEGFKSKLISMDVSTEEFTVKALPSLPVSQFTEHDTFSSSGALYHARTSPGSCYELEVWAMDDFDKPAWSRYCVMRLKPSVDATSWNQFEVIGILQEGAEVIVRLRTDNQILIYNLASKLWRKTSIVWCNHSPMVAGECSWHHAAYHVNSLVGGWMVSAEACGSSKKRKVELLGAFPQI